MKYINNVFMMKLSMTSKIMLGAIIAIAALAGTITTGTIANAAKPNPDGDGDGETEGIIHEIIDLLNHVTFGLEAIQNAITSVQTDITMIKSDVGDIKTETDKIQMIKDDVGAIKSESDKIQMVKDDVGAIKTETDKIPMVKTDIGNLQTDVTMVKSDIADIKTQLGSKSEPLTQFENYKLVVAEDDSGSLDIESTGPMEVIICDARSTDGFWFISFVSGDIFLVQANDGQCVPIGVPTGDVLNVRAKADSDRADGFVSIRSTPSAEITITGHGIIDITE